MKTAVESVPDPFDEIHGFTNFRENRVLEKEYVASLIGL